MCIVWFVYWFALLLRACVCSLNALPAVSEVRRSAQLLSKTEFFGNRHPFPPSKTKLAISSRDCRGRLARKTGTPPPPNKVQTVVWYTRSPHTVQLDGAVVVAAGATVGFAGISVAVNCTGRQHSNVSASPLTHSTKRTLTYAFVRELSGAQNLGQVAGERLVFTQLHSCRLHRPAAVTINTTEIQSAQSQAANAHTASSQLLTDRTWCKNPPIPGTV